MKKNMKNKILLFLAGIILTSTLILGCFIINNYLTLENKTKEENRDSSEKTNKAIREPSVSLNSTSKPELLIEHFFNHIKKKEFEKAYQLTDNELWKPYLNFSGDVWGNYTSTVPIKILKKNYHSKYGANQILEVTFVAYDLKEKKENELKYDFHLKRIEESWKIVRMTYAKAETTWYKDDPLYKGKDDPKMKIFNRPHVILQAYYDNFKTRNSTRSNTLYYNDTLLIHFNEEMISKSEAINKDFMDFQNNDIKSYEILVNSYGMITNKYELFDIVNVPLKYYITKIDGKRSKFVVDITAVLNKSNNKIIAIDRSISIEELNDALER
jgi:hypothetical protein